jgi:N-methylhydantoinase A
MQRRGRDVDPPDRSPSASASAVEAARSAARRPLVGRLSIGIDMGGTFVDCVALGAAERCVGKAPATPDAPSEGIVEALRHAARDGGLTLEELLGDCSDIVHGTTLGLNALLTRSGGRVGLLTTRGHEDAILVGRVHQKVAGLRPQELTRASELRKPEPLVPRWLIRGVHERIAADGAEVVVLDEDGLIAAATELVEAGSEALAISFLWSFRSPGHERRSAELVRAAFPWVPVVLSSDIAPVLGEYERTATTIVDAFLRRPFAGYLDRLASDLKAVGFGGELWMLGMTGGLLRAQTATSRPIETLRSGPVGGIMAARSIGARLGRGDVIATDMGGTSFDVGLLSDGRPELADVTILAQLHLALPGIEVRSIGAGGGSIAWLDRWDGIHVGPHSAGASPGPACYGRGGTAPTVTDADLVLGRLDPAAVLGDAIRLDRDAAVAAIEPIAERLGLDVVGAADGIVRVADAQMADLIRTATIERGHDPRSAILVAFGGAGPLHVGRFATDVGIVEAIIPPAASVLSAVGLASAEYHRTYRRSRPMAMPLDPGEVRALFEDLEVQARRDFESTGIEAPLALERWIELRYRRQTHQLRVAVPDDSHLRTLDWVAGAFERLYERTYGPGTGYAAAGIEATAAGVGVAAPRRIDGNGPPGDASVSVTKRSVDADPIGHRAVFFDSWIDTPVYRGSEVRRGSTVDGPAVIDWPSTTLVIHPGQSATVGSTGDIHLRLGRWAAV